MEAQVSGFDAHHVIDELKHYLPAQAPLKDFIHHNTLHAFQNFQFDEGLRKASEMFGYKVSLTLEEFRELFGSQRISAAVLEKTIATRKGKNKVAEWMQKLTNEPYNTDNTPRIGALRANWKNHYRIDLDSLVHPLLFRLLCSYLDQGISMWSFPANDQGFLSAIRAIERNSFTSFFKNKRAKSLLINNKCDLGSLLKLVVGHETLYAQYLFDQQFAHQGWSGMVAAVESQPETLINSKKITLEELIAFELLLEIDVLDTHFGETWSALGHKIEEKPLAIFAAVPRTELNEVFEIWQEAFEWTYYDQVLAGIQTPKPARKSANAGRSFQAMFCIDDRECSFRRYLENTDPNCETFGTPGFFGVEFFYQPDQGKFTTKLCPAPVTPKYLIKETGSAAKRGTEVIFAKQSHALFRGWLISQTLGFWAAAKLFVNLFKPSMSPATASSFKHMDRFSTLTVENKPTHKPEHGLQVGFKIEEMATRVEELLKSIGLVKDFAPLVYVVGHGSSSINNPHYAAYDCGACCGRPGSVNARVISDMANRPEVRELLRARGVDIPATTQFVGGLHDTTRDEVMFFDEHLLATDNRAGHQANEATFAKALDMNAKERSRRFESIDTRLTPQAIHQQILTRSVSLFEPRPELNHATNALCIVGRRSLTDGLFLDRRSFLNSYNYEIDPEGKFLFNILKAAAPVCGGINLEYFFSRVDNQKLGAGTKLPHNVMGLFGVANGIDGDLRPGLPSQMIEVHDPIRLLIIVEHLPEVVLQTIQKAPETYEWFINEWVRLVVVHPETKDLFEFKNGSFRAYHTVGGPVEIIHDLSSLLATSQENFPVYLIEK